MDEGTKDQVHGFWYMKFHTPLKINMEPKNHPLEKENHLPNLHYCVPCQFSWVYQYRFYQWSPNWQHLPPEYTNIKVFTSVVGVFEECYTHEG